MLQTYNATQCYFYVYIKKAYKEKGAPKGTKPYHLVAEADVCFNFVDMFFSWKIRLWNLMAPPFLGMFLFWCLFFLKSRFLSLTLTTLNLDVSFSRSCSWKLCASWCFFSGQFSIMASNSLLAPLCLDIPFSADDVCVCLFVRFTEKGRNRAELAQNQLQALIWD